MTDVLGSYMSDLRELGHKWGPTLGWMPAVMKERGLIPEEAQWVCLSIGPSEHFLGWSIDRPVYGDDWNWLELVLDPDA